MFILSFLCLQKTLTNAHFIHMSAQCTGGSQGEADCTHRVFLNNLTENLGLEKKAGKQVHGMCFLCPAGHHGILDPCVCCLLWAFNRGRKQGRKAGKSCLSSWIPLYPYPPTTSLVTACSFGSLATFHVDDPPINPINCKNKRSKILDTAWAK